MSKRGVSQSIVYMTKHVSFELYRVNADGIFRKKLANYEKIKRFTSNDVFPKIAC